MLDVNDFDAIRISLASPEAIRSWSYGEVTKPETINYRTLKPEHGGLFCERIFGPSRDWECYCGKYKRIRFKGIVCDKCGVEVARSKVRRERMGHIELAAPTSHIWYVKGTPSRLGLLLDISPRNLERIIYFAAYLVTEVSEEAKQARVAQFRQELEDELADIDAEYQESQEERTEELRGALESLTARQAEAGAEVAQRLAAGQKEAKAKYSELKRALNKALNGAADKEYKYFDTVIVEPGATINEERLAALDAARDDRLQELADSAAHERASGQALVEAERDQRAFASGEEAEKRSAEAEREKADTRQDYEQRISALEKLQPLQILTEVQRNELLEDGRDVFKAGMGAEAVYDVVSRLDLDDQAAKLRQEMATMTGLKRKKATKRLRVVEALRKGHNRPEWMIFTALPVIPPDLRPMVQLDGGRFATSDLNDLYRRVINRNNRLRRLLDLQAPDIIVRNEKRMLQEAVDALIDNGRRGRVVAGSGKHKLKSLSDMLKGKQGRFRQNLLGKRVDYSGRSVIVVGPDLELHQCGLPKRMALELFKPFVMRRLVERGHAFNIKAAKRVVERVDPRVWEVLEEVTKEYLVLLNRAPTLHRLGIQAFEVKLVEGNAIQIHPLVCAAYNADFDGDQMAVHVPLAKAAQEEARTRMLSVRNLLSPSNGDPVITPQQDIVLGCYYMTLPRDGALGEGKVFVDKDEVLLAYESGLLDLQAQVRVRQDGDAGSDGKNGATYLETTVGRVIFNQEVPEELGYRNVVMDRKELRRLVADCYRHLGPERTAVLADRIKGLGFRYATRGALSIGIADVEIPPAKAAIIEGAEAEQDELEKQFRRGLITDDERYKEAVRIWTEARASVATAVEKGLDRQNPLYMMAQSGARGNFNQISQMAGMRGLVLNPVGNVIELPIKSNFREGISVLEYFISTHGARKGLADTALRTADSGYLTRRLVDVAQDVIITTEDCGTEDSLRLLLRPTTAREKQDPATFFEVLSSRLRGRRAAQPLVHPASGEVLVDRNEELTEELVDRLLELAAREEGPEEVFIRTVMFCDATYGVCRHCYGRNLATGRLVDLGEAVGIVAAQSIGEPGTQLTMRTFHLGGVAHAIDITTGLPRVEEIFEARVPRGQAILAGIEGTVALDLEGDARLLRITNTELVSESYPLPANYAPTVEEGDEVAEGQVLAESNVEGVEGRVLATISGKVNFDGETIVVRDEQTQTKEYHVPHDAQILVSDGDFVTAGRQLTEGNQDPQEILTIRGRKAVQEYMVDEVRSVYRSQGVDTNDKHIEVIVRQMLRKVTIDEPGDSDFLPGELIDRFVLAEINAELLAEGGEPSTAQETLLGVTKASLSTESFLSAASFQETTRVLTEAAIHGRVDSLRGLKENVIIGKLIPAGSGFNVQKTKRPTRGKPDGEEPSIETIDLMSGPEGVGKDRGDLVPAGFQALPVDPTLTLGDTKRDDEE